MSELPAAPEKADQRTAVDAISRHVGEAEPVGYPEAGTTALLTARQLAERWQVPVRTVYAWAKRNAVPHYRAGRLLRFDAVAVEEHFRRHGFADEIEPDADRPGESAFALLSG
jgi:excisionase family DNA binding protein